ncbi:MAG: flotillin family protein [Deltaproteobacteria bacterium]|nr:flotillin family protein [Deltaproteobacteria bacterium]
MIPRLFVLVAAGVTLALTLLVLVGRMIRVVGPSELFVISGRRRQIGDQSLGYRLLRGGRALQLPWVERLDRLDLTVLTVTFARRGLLSKDLVPLRVEVEAFVRVAGHAPTADAAAECLLGRSRGQIEELARALLEGSLAHVVAACSPELMRNDPAHFEHLLVAEAEQDLHRVGLEIDRLSLGSVDDDPG